jgi:hypothetical protein
MKRFEDVAARTSAEVARTLSGSRGEPDNARPTEIHLATTRAGRLRSSLPGSHDRAAREPVAGMTGRIAEVIVLPGMNNDGRPVRVQQ